MGSHGSRYRQHEFVLCAALTLWLFLGVESATIPADDVTNSKKTIPRATVLGTIVMALVYILSAVAVMVMNLVKLVVR